MSETTTVEKACQAPQSDLDRDLGVFFIEHAAHRLMHAPPFSVSCDDCHISLNVPATSAPAPTGEAPTYPCARCGVLRTKAEGGTTFTVCDKCWEATRPTGEAQPVTQECCWMESKKIAHRIVYAVDSVGDPRDYTSAHEFHRQRVEAAAEIVHAARTPAPAPEWVGEYRRDLAQIARAVKAALPNSDINIALRSMLDRLPSSPAQTENAEEGMREE